MRSQEKNVVMLCLLYFPSCIASISPHDYTQTFLEYVGYNVVKRDIIPSGVAVVTIIAQFFIDYLYDKYKTDKKFFNLCLIVFVLSTLVMYQMIQHNFPLYLILISPVGGMFRTTLTVQDTQTSGTSETCRNNFGPIRVFDVISWTIGSSIGALVVEHRSCPALGYMFAGFAVLNILLTMFIQDAVKMEKSGRIHASDLRELLLDKKYVVVVLIFLFTDVTTAADIYTAVDKMTALGAKGGIVGTKWSIQAFTELLLFFAGTWLLKKFGDYKPMTFDIFTYIIRLLGYAVVQSPEMMAMVTLMQYIAYPLIMIASRTLVDDTTPVHLRSSRQTIVSTLYVGLSPLTIPMIVGTMVPSLGADPTLMLIGLNGFIPLGLGISYKRLDQ